MASLGKLQSEVQKAWPGKHMWLTEYGYQTNPPDKANGVSWEKQAQYIGESALHVYRAARVDMLIQFMVRDDPDPSGWQSGFYTTSGKKKPSYDAWRFPLAQSRKAGEERDAPGSDPPGQRRAQLPAPDVQGRLASARQDGEDERFGLLHAKGGTREGHPRARVLAARPRVQPAAHGQVTATS